MREEILKVVNLSFAYEDVPVLKDISLSVAKGEKIAVMGANGAGKSTFFLQLNGVLKPDRGEIYFKGKKAERKNRKMLQKGIGFVFQDADSQIIGSTVRTEISFGPMNLGLEREQVKQRVERAMDYLSLSSLGNRPPHSLSGGEKKRVSIADILAMEPEVFLFDEPMAALDPQNAEQVEEILTRLHREGKTLFVATHDVDFAYRFADRCVVFVEGQIIADGTVCEIFNNKDVMRRAHLRKPAVMTLWEALQKNGLAGEAESCPRTPEKLAEKIKKGGFFI